MDSIDKLYKSVALILLLLTTNSVLKTSSYWANGPEPPSMPLPPLSKEEEAAVNDLFILAEVPQKLQNNFSTLQCDQKSIFCNCSTTSCHVTEIDLSECDLKGTISPQIGNLFHLTRLALNKRANIIRQTVRYGTASEEKERHGNKGKGLSIRSEKKIAVR